MGESPRLVFQSRTFLLTTYFIDCIIFNIKGEKMLTGQSLFGTSTPPDSEVFYKIGDAFYLGDEDYILALVDGEHNTLYCCLISLSDGNRWANPTKVKNQYKITEEELAEIGDGEEFIRYQKDACITVTL
jgi:hypothetical protein